MVGGARVAQGKWDFAAFLMCYVMFKSEMVWMGVDVMVRVRGYECVRDLVAERLRERGERENERLRLGRSSRRPCFSQLQASLFR